MHLQQNEESKEPASNSFILTRDSSHLKDSGISLNENQLSPNPPDYNRIVSDDSDEITVGTTESQRDQNVLSTENSTLGDENPDKNVENLNKNVENSINTAEIQMHADENPIEIVENPIKVLGNPDEITEDRVSIIEDNEDKVNIEVPQHEHHDEFNKVRYSK